MRIKRLSFVDVMAQDGESFLSFPVSKVLASDDLKDWSVFPGSGDCFQREIQIQEIEANGWNLPRLIAPTATLGAGCHISDGCFIGHHAHVGPMARVGKGCIVNTAAVIEHECVIGDYSHISVHSTIAGRSYIGPFSMLGAGATIIDSISICEHVTIGAGAVVCNSITESGIFAGIPARKLYSKP